MIGINMEDRRRREDYVEDKKYIHETLKHTAKYVKELDGKFEEFKLTTATSIATIQTKLGVYVLVGSFIMGVAVNIGIKLLFGGK
jgi:hypothetical protein